MLKISIPPVGLAGGISMWLFLTLGFRFTGYTMPLSICLGILGGTACGLVVTWWNTEEEKPINVDEIASEKLTENLPNFLIPESEKTQPPKKLQSSNRSSGRAVTLLDWLFRKKR